MAKIKHTEGKKENRSKASSGSSRGGMKQVKFANMSRVQSSHKSFVQKKKDGNKKTKKTVKRSSKKEESESEDSESEDDSVMIGRTLRKRIATTIPTGYEVQKDAISFLGKCLVKIVDSILMDSHLLANKQGSADIDIRQVSTVVSANPLI